MRKTTFAVGVLLAGALTAGAAASVSFADTGTSTHTQGAGSTSTMTTAATSTAAATLACPSPYKATKTEILGTDVLLCAKTGRGRHDQAPTVTVTAPPSTTTVTVTAPATSTTSSTSTPIEPVAIIGQFCRTQGERAVTKASVDVVCALGASNRLRWRILS